MKSCNISGNQLLQKKYAKSISFLDKDLLDLKLASPALRALVNNRIKSAVQLKRFTRSQVLTWHGIGPAAVEKLSPFLKPSPMP